MEKKILIAVDNTRPSKRAIHYAVQLSSVVNKLHFVLIHIQPMISLYLQEEANKSASARRELNKVLEKNAQFAEKLLGDFRDEMEKTGIGSDRIECITQERKLGYAKDIIDYAHKERCDAIVVGRRGVSGIIKMYAGSVTTNILEQSQVIPVWLVDGNVSSSEMLMAIDGSEVSLRAVDHASFILSGNSEIRLTLLHVTNNARNYCEIDLEEQPNPELEEIVARTDKACIDQFYSHAIKRFKDAGISADRIKIETVKGSRQAGKTILDFAQNGNYGTVIIGRRGINKSFFMGSVSRFLINKVSEKALWIVP